MKKFVICIGVLVIVATNVFAVNFSPIVMNISAPEVIDYDFDGKSIDIPLTLTGTKGSVILTASILSATVEVTAGGW